MIDLTCLALILSATLCGELYLRRLNRRLAVQKAAYQGDQWGQVFRGRVVERRVP